MGILNPKGNLYSKVPTNPSPTKTRNPMSPLPQPPPVPGTYLTDYIVVKSTGFSIQILIGIPYNIFLKKRFISFIKKIDLMLLLTHVCKTNRLMLWSMDNGHVMRTFFKKFPNNWPIWADGLNNLMGTWGYFQLKFQHTFCHCVSLVHYFAFINHFSTKKLSFQDILKENLFRFGIRIRDLAIACPQSVLWSN